MSLVQNIAAILGLILAFGAVVAMFNRFGHGMVDALDDRIEQRMEPLRKQVADIHHEVTYNNGSSLKDLVSRVSEQASAAAKLAAEVKADLDASHERADAVDGEAGAAADAASKTP
jgi:hypothetical protein